MSFFVLCSKLASMFDLKERLTLESGIFGTGVSPNPNAIIEYCPYVMT